MKRQRFGRRGRKIRRRNSIKQSNWWPFLLIGGAILLILSIAALMLF